MKRYLYVLIVVASCAGFAIVGYAVGAYMQFLQTFNGQQGRFAHELIDARLLMRNQSVELLKLLQEDIPLQYQFLTGYEEIRNAPLPIRLSTVTRVTWSNWPLASQGVRSSAQWQKMMHDCECGLAVPDPKH